MDKADKKNKSHQIILTLDLTSLTFNVILTIDFYLFFLGSIRWWVRFSDCKIELEARSWDERSIKGAELMKGGPQGGPKWGP